MAKFKVGDKVEILAGPKSGKVGKIETSAPGPQGSEMYHIRLEDGLLVDAIERNLTLANSAPVSTNSVVRNAMAARTARTATRQTFGKVVAVSEDPFEDSSIFIGGGLMHRAEGTTVEKCLVEAEVMLDEYETVVRQLKSAIAWMRTKK